MSRKRKIGDMDCSAVENARKVKRVLALKKGEVDCYHCPVINCDHPGFTTLALQVSGDVENMLKSVQSALSDLKRPLNVYNPSAIIGLSLLNSILMARFLKQSFSRTCLKETDNGKLQQFNYSRSMITNRGTIESAKNYCASLGRKT